MNPIMDTTTQEDITLKLRIRETFKDTAGLPVKYTAKISMGTGSVSILGDSLIYIPPLNWSGHTQVTLFGVAGANANFTQFFLSILPVNDAPTFTGTWGSQPFHNNDKLIIDFRDKVKDQETPQSLALQFDSIPGCIIDTTGLTLALGCPRRIDKGSLHLRLADPDGAFSPYINIPFNPNAPVHGDTLRLYETLSNEKTARTFIFGYPNPGFSVFTYDSNWITRDTYLPDGSKAHQTRFGKFTDVKATGYVQVFMVGGNCLVAVQSKDLTGMGSSYALYLFDAEMNLVKVLAAPPSTNYSVLGIDSTNRRFYLSKTVFSENGLSKRYIEAYGFNFNSLPIPAFASTLIQNLAATLNFAAGRTMVLSPSSPSEPLTIKVESYLPNGQRFDSVLIPIDHQPSNKQLKSEMGTYLLAPYSKGFSLFMSIQDVMINPDGSSSYALADFHSLRQKFTFGFRVDGNAQTFDRLPTDFIYPLEIIDLVDTYLLVSQGDSRNFLPFHRQYLQKFNTDMEPLEKAELRVFSTNDLLAPPAFAKIVNRTYGELQQYTNGHNVIVMHTLAPVAVCIKRVASKRVQQAPAKTIFRINNRGPFDVRGKFLLEK